MRPSSVPIGRDQFVWALGAMCRSYRLPFDPVLALQQSPPPHSVDSLISAAQALGLCADCAKMRRGSLDGIRVPCFILHASDDHANADRTPLHRADRGRAANGTALRLSLIVKLDGDQAWIVEENSPEPRVVQWKFPGRGSGSRVLQFHPAPKPLADPDARAKSSFGFGWFARELMKHGAIWREVLLASLAIQVAALGVPLFTQLVIDKVVVHQTVNTLLVVAVALAIIMIFSAVMNWLRQYLVLRTGNLVDAALGARVFEHLLALPPRYFERRPTGALVARMHGVEVIRDFLSGAAITLLLDCPFLAVFVAIMLYYSWELTMVALAILALLAAISIAIVPFIRARLNEQFFLGARNQAFLTEYVAAIETVKSLQMEPQLREDYQGFLWSYLQASFSARQLANSYGVLANGLEQLMTLAVLVLGAWLVMQNDGFTIGMLVAFQMFSGRLAQPMLRLAGLWQEFQQAEIAVRRLGDVMNVPPEPYRIAPSRAPAEGGEIEIENLSFRYSDDLPYLYRGLDLRIPQGSCVAILGPSGSGKSTLARLLQGFYPFAEGRIRINGRDIRHLSANELRMTFGVVPQETVLFSGSIHENLVRANPHATFAEVISACKSAGVHDVIEALPDGYHSVIGEHGTGLSGGQKQRIAIARALLKRPQALIFDEATSQLDAAAAAPFVAAVNRLKGKTTLIIITHQLPAELAVDNTILLAGAGAARDAETGVLSEAEAKIAPSRDGRFAESR